jgi:UDP-N-acetylmuramate dehydrogenase
MTLLDSVDLASFTTFGIHTRAQHVVVVTSRAELTEALAWAREHNVPWRILGGGSNVLLTQDVAGMVIVMRIVGREMVHDGDDVLITCGAGEVWHDIVTWTVEQGWGGFENMALIPGTIGAAPMQNIGAYGVEQASCFVSCDALDVVTGEISTYTNDACAFGYRESVFKHALRDRAVILSVTYRLQRTPKIVTSYRDVAEELQRNNILEPTVHDVYTAVVAIRRRKLPDPAEIGNAGSFFKNPVVSRAVYDAVAAQYPDVPHYAQQDGTVKLPAAWLIDTCGWKGYRSGDAGVHARQALVLVNYGTATGDEILDIATRIQSDVRERFGIALEREVNVW